MQTLHSFWHLTLEGPQHGVLLRKLERLAGFTALDPSVERILWEGRKEAHATFMVAHTVASTQDAQAALLELSWRLSPTWRITRAGGDLEGEWSESAVGPTHPFELIIGGCRSIRWQLHASQAYTRPAFLGGHANHW